MRRPFKVPCLSYFESKLELNSQLREYKCENRRCDNWPRTIKGQITHLRYIVMPLPPLRLRI